MTEREALIKELTVIAYSIPDGWRMDKLADFIIEDRKRIVEEIMNLYSSEQWEGLKTLRGLI